MSTYKYRISRQVTKARGIVQGYRCYFGTTDDGARDMGCEKGDRTLWEKTSDQRTTDRNRGREERLLVQETYENKEKLILIEVKKARRTCVVGLY